MKHNCKDCAYFSSIAIISTDKNYKIPNEAKIVGCRKIYNIVVKNSKFPFENTSCEYFVEKEKQLEQK